MAIDVQKLLSEVAPEAPCGEELSYDPAYMELERLAQGTPEQQVGTTIVEAQEPDWKAVRQAAVELLARTKDLRVAMFLALAQLQLDGLPGLRDGLAVLRGMLEKWWDGIYPRLDPDDGNDPMERMNILSSLSPSADVYGDRMQFRNRLRAVPIILSKQLGRFAWREVSIAKGEAPFTGEGTAPDMAVIEGAIASADVDQLKAVATAAKEAGEHIEAIDRALGGYVGAGKAPNLDELRKALNEIGDFLLQRLGMPAGGQPAGAEAAGGGNASGPAGPAIAGEIRSREDVVRMLDKIADFYARTEPSSPVPLLIRRARKLVPMNFMEIIKDLTPDALGQIQSISGAEKTEP
jgi:type VI secretion system protein ImpA